MKVRELISLLEDFDGEADVRIMSQQSWPFENSIYDVTDRQSFAGHEDCECDEECGHAVSGECECGECAFGTDADGNPLQASDVFIVEGRQLCYGSKDAWNVR